MYTGMERFYEAFARAAVLSVRTVLLTRDLIIARLDTERWRR